MRRILAVAGAGAILAAAVLAVSVASTETTLAASTGATFVVPANDGYGVGDCIGSGSACGKVVADAWCEAQGFARSDHFGLVDPADVTGSIDTPRSSSRPISITCAQ